VVRAFVDTIGEVGSSASRPIHPLPPPHLNPNTLYFSLYLCQFDRIPAILPELATAFCGDPSPEHLLTGVTVLLHLPSPRTDPNTCPLLSSLNHSANISSLLGYDGCSSKSASAFAMMRRSFSASLGRALAPLLTHDPVYSTASTQHQHQQLFLHLSFPLLLARRLELDTPPPVLPRIGFCSSS
jgi:hypothetical protein